MSWDIVYTAQARQDLRDIYEYIALELLAPETVTGQIQRIMKTIRSLGEMPCVINFMEKNRGIVGESAF